MPQTALRRDVSIPGLLAIARRVFNGIPDEQASEGLPLSDHLMSGLALFLLKYPSLLQFDQDSRYNGRIKHNLRTLYGIQQAPCDTYLRERLDEVDPSQLRVVYKKLFAALQRAKGLEGFEVLDEHYLLSIDGTGYFSSKKVHCKHCCEKHHRNGEVTYYHQLLGAVLVHPDRSEVFPLAPEPILKQDGHRKNDCERNAAKRLLADTRRDHPHLKLIVVEDALASNGLHIQQLQRLNYRFILGAKEADHPFLFDWVKTTPGTQEDTHTDEHGVIHRFRYHANAPLNATHFDLTVNFLEYWETKRNGKTQHFSWVTDLPLTQERFMSMMRAGRARWRIENETFNTLKTQGYHFEHNFGHGDQHLSTVLAHLMMLAFLMDQIQQRCCRLFQRSLAKRGRKKYFWEHLRSCIDLMLIPNWELLYRNIAGDINPILAPNTS